MTAKVGFFQATPAKRAGGTAISTRNATPDWRKVVGRRVSANFARRWRVFSASTTGAAREGPYAREDGPTRWTDFRAGDAAATAENGVPRA